METTGTTLRRVKRVFKYNSLKLDDIEGMDPEEVKDFYANIYPELSQSVIDGPTLSGNEEVYEFKKTVGTKGITVKQIANGEKMPASKTLDIETSGKLANIFSNIHSGTPLLPPSEVQDIIL